MLDLENTITVRQVGQVGTRSNLTGGSVSVLPGQYYLICMAMGPVVSEEGERERGDRTSLMNGTTLLGFTQI